MSEAAAAVISTTKYSFSLVWNNPKSTSRCLNVGKAFAIATAIVFGGATLVFGMVASKLDLRHIDDVKIKGKDAVEPKFDTIKEQLTPLKIWAENMNKKWRMEREGDLKEKPIIKELSKMFGAKTYDWRMEIGASAHIYIGILVGVCLWLFCVAVKLEE
ncbi:hypothetical protein K1719_012177 [Acacia pycnantha]|nr:hypothetical protein K1719_012177 [Acacia pycnantha]